MTPPNFTKLMTQSNSLANRTQAMLQITKTNSQRFFGPVTSRRIEPLREEHKNEALGFLATRTEHTFVMAGWILDNGLVSPLNRGTFYGHRNERGQLDGVALIGHVTLFETNNEVALAAFARLAQDCSSARVVMAKANNLQRFLAYFTNEQRPRLMCREQLFEQHHEQKIEEAVPGLRLATPDNLELVVPVHAQMAFEESGVNPLFVDPEGFYQRCARRIEQQRVWVLVENRQLIFKADIISDMPEVVYLEGVYVSPNRRGEGLGPRCVKQLTNELLKRTKSVCLLVNPENTAAQTCYRKAGYRLLDVYDTLYLNQDRDLIAH